MAHLDGVVHGIAPKQGILSIRLQNDHRMVGTMSRHGYATQTISEVHRPGLIDSAGKPCIKYGLDAVAIDRLTLWIMSPVLKTLLGKDIAGVRKHWLPFDAVVIGVPTDMINVQMRHQHRVHLQSIYSRRSKVFCKVRMQMVEEWTAITVPVIANPRVNDDQSIWHAYDPTMNGERQFVGKVNG